MDVLHEDTLVLEDVTLGLLVERVVPSQEHVLANCPNLGVETQNSQVLINLARLPVLPQQPTENPLPPHPLHLGRHTSIGGTLPLTGTGVATLALRGQELLRAGSRVNGGGLDDDATVLDELLDMGAGVGVPDFRLLGGVEPDFTLADARDGCGEPPSGR